MHPLTVITAFNQNSLKFPQNSYSPAGIQLVMPEIGSHGCQDNKNGSNESQQMVERFYGKLSEVFGADVVVGKQLEVMVGADVFQLEDLRTN